MLKTGLELKAARDPRTTMPKPHVIVGVVSDLLTPAGMVLSGTDVALSKPGVRFEHGETAYFDLTNITSASRHAAIFETLQRTGWPVHIEVQRDGTIEAARIPAIGRVLRVVEAGAGAYAVTLDRNEMRFTIDRSQSDALRVLQSAVGKDAPLLIAHKGGWIVDVQPLRASIVFDTPPFARVPCGSELRTETSILPNEADIDALVKAMMTHTCVLPAADADCIPFTFVEGGCLARAHRMCELLADRAVVAGKVWLFGDLHVATPNRSECKVPWSSHVAPFVRLNTKGGPDIRVIDPSMFPERSAPLEEWFDAHSDPKARRLYSNASIYDLTEICAGRLESPNITGRNLRETIVDLQDYRTMLLDMDPPPPFDHCETTSPRTIAESSGRDAAEPTPE